ncbi:MAG: DMT family transporter [Pseudomonadota bacterium]
MSDNLRGILLMVAAMAAFALEDAFIKTVTERLPVSQVLLVLGVGGALIFAVWTRATGRWLITPDILTLPVMVRNLSEMLGTICFVTAITLTPLASASAILQATPLVVTFGAAVFLGEQVGWRRWTAISVGLVGVLMIVRPGFEGFQPASLFTVGAVIFLSTRDLATRVTPPRVSTIQLSAYAFAAVALAALPMIPFGPAHVVPTWPEMVLLTGALGVGVLGYVAITNAMRVGEVSVVTPFRYTRLLFALFLAALVFGERPDGWTLTGAAIIIGSGLYVLARERIHGGKAL